MTVHRLAEMTWTEVRDVARGGVALWPIGAIEAHGPHLPLATDVIISEEMARRAAEKLMDEVVMLLPALPFTPAGYASEFAGTLAVSSPAVVEMIRCVAESLEKHGMRMLVLVNSHVDPENVRALNEACRRKRGGIPILFPDKCQRPWVLKLPEEFRRGGAHAGYYETSLILAARPDLVREETRKRLAKVDVNLVQKIREGATTFCECGGSDAYFGNPAGASAADGDRFYDILSDMIVVTVREGGV